MISSDKIEQPIIHHLMMITKKYLSTFADLTHEIPLERYHFALTHIYQHHETLTQKDLADYFQVDKSSIVTMIDHLSKNDFVYRETATEDRRKHFIRLTEKALRFIPQINDAIKEANQLALGLISQTDAKHFLELAKQLESNLEKDSEHLITIDYKKSKI